MWFCSALGNVVWPKLLNENRGKVLQQLPLMIIFPQMAKKLDSELYESDEVLTILNMAGEVIPKLEQVLEKLENLERYVKAVDKKVSTLQAKVDCFESFKKKKKSEKKIKELEDGLDFANTECKSFKEKFDKLKCEINQLRDEKLCMEVYQRRENLRFFGIKEEADTEEDAREVLIGFLKTELGMENADQIDK